jgi:hypothetical protein
MSKSSSGRIGEGDSALGVQPAERKHNVSPFNEMYQTKDLAQSSNAIFKIRLRDDII